MTEIFCVYCDGAHHDIGVLTCHLEELNKHLRKIAKCLDKPTQLVK